VEGVAEAIWSGAEEGVGVVVSEGGREEGTGVWEGVMVEEGVEAEVTLGEAV